ncbi:tRNA pseudouridine(55) synthase TruB [bacterium]|nr:tRNA pseudouridine(55) synthase TruB [bacterium]
MFGFLNVYKPAGITSHDVVNKLRRVLKIKKIGHAGTLDPLAQGVLPVAISNATRLIDFLSDEKEYIADFQLGVCSKSYDTESEIEFYSDKKVSNTDISNILENFKGRIKQKPPIYSAVKVGGKKLYELARNGETCDIQEREVIINKIILENFDEKNQKGKIVINCSKGTYIRSIINDMGLLLKTGAIMTGLTRIKSGGMYIDDSLNVNDINEISKVQKNIISVTTLLNFPQINLTEYEFNKVKNGNSIDAKGFYLGNVFLKHNNTIIALGEFDKNLIKIKKVFI